MNQQPSNQTGVTGFSSGQTNPQSNPFAADFQGQFSSSFGTVGGTNTNVSQIFKEGGSFGGDNRKKFIIIGGVIAVFAIIIGFMMMSGSETSDFEKEFAENETDFPEDGAKDVTAETGDATTVAQDPTAVAAEGMATAPRAGARTSTAANTATANEMAPTGSVQLVSPADGQSWNYDETQGAAPFQWDGGGGFIVFSRSSSMTPEYMRVPVSGNNYAFNNPYPGTWYWRVENNSGASEVRRFQVSAPIRRTLAVTQPANGAGLAANGGVVSWQRAEKVAFYRVEFSNSGFANPQYRFATSDVAVQVQGMAPGTYQMRLGAFSEVAGRWEYTAPQSVSVR